MSQDILDLSQDTQYDLIIKKDRTLASIITCVYLTGTTTPVEVDFDFSSYSAAELDVKRDSKSSQVILNFSTTDGSIVLSTGNTFQLNKTYTELANIKTGEFYYDMYLTSVSYPKRAFLSGKFIIEDRITT